MGTVEKLNMERLSDDAKVIASCWFGNMRVGGQSDLTLHLRESRPAPRTQAALDELVDRGAISVEPFNRYGGIVYRPLVDCFDALLWFARLSDAEREPHNFPLMVSVEAAG